jgi:hypothetical protein
MRGVASLRSALGQVFARFIGSAVAVAFHLLLRQVLLAVRTASSLTATRSTRLYADLRPAADRMRSASSGADGRASAAGHGRAAPPERTEVTKSTHSAVVLGHGLRAACFALHRIIYAALCMRTV